MITLGAVQLGLAVSRRLAKDEGRTDLIKTLVKAVGDDGKISPIEWATIGKLLGVFDIKSK